MGKRSDFPRRARDFYPTPYEAVLPLLPHLKDINNFAEPCCGDGSLVNHLQQRGKVCQWLSDIEPQTKCDAACSLFDLNQNDLWACDAIITNPPWPKPHKQGEPTVAMALHLSDIMPTWLLLSADFKHNKYYGHLANRCDKVVSVGRVSWEQNGISGKDNCAWYLFENRKRKIPYAKFYGRAA